MPAGQGKDTERFAAAIEQGTPPGSVVDADLAGDLEIVATLRSRGAAYAPHPQARAAAKQRMMAALAAQQAAEQQLVDDSGHPMAAERTVPLCPVRPAAPADPAAVTSVISQVPVDPAAETLPARAVPLLADDAPDGDDAPDRDVVAASEDAPRPRRTGRHSMPTRPGGRARSGTRPGVGSLRRRVLVVGAAALLALVAIGAGSLASRDALPGDTLYAMKRFSENVGLALTLDDESRARRHLDLATERLDEVEALVTDGSREPDADAVETAIREFEASVGEGSRGLLAGEDASGAASLGDLRAWAAEQAARLSILRASLPEPAVAEADGSIELLDRLLGRTAALETRSSCTEITSNVVDELGPLPAEGICAPRPVDTDGDDTSDEPSPTSGTDGGTGSGGTGSGDPGSTPDSAGESGTPGLLPDLGPDGLPATGDGAADDGAADDGAAGDGATDGTTDPPTSGTPGDDDPISVPLPLIPQIQLPPLLPGLPGVTLG